MDIEKIVDRKEFVDFAKTPFTILGCNDKPKEEYMYMVATNCPFNAIDLFDCEITDVGREYYNGEVVAFVKFKTRPTIVNENFDGLYKKFRAKAHILGFFVSNYISEICRKSIFDFLGQRLRLNNVVITKVIDDDENRYEIRGIENAFKYVDYVDRSSIVPNQMSTTTFPTPLPHKPAEMAKEVIIPKVKDGMMCLELKDIKFSGDKTIAFWDNGEKTIVTMQDDEHEFDPEKAIMACYMKRIFELYKNSTGKSVSIKKIFDKYLAKYEKEKPEIEVQIQKIKQRKADKERIQNDRFKELKEMYDRHEITNSQFAAKLGVSKSHLNKLLKNCE